MEGWVLGGGGIGISEGAVQIDPVEGLAAWNINDTSTASSSTGNYSMTPTTAQMKRAAEEGWVLSARLRLVDSPDDLDASVFAEYASNIDGLNRKFGMIFGSNADGDPLVSFFQDQSICLEGLGSGYHLYELKYDPVAGTADLFVDGVEYLSDYAGIDNTNLVARVIWGAAQSNSTGNANYNMIYFRNSLAEPLPGDANCDGVVDAADAAILASNWLITSMVTWEMGDFNDDGAIDDIDATILATNWGRGAIGANVPEPYTLMLMLLGSMMLMIYRGSHRR